MARLNHGLGFLFRALADFFFPPICYGCEEEAEQGLVCDSCRLLLFTSELDVCPNCGRACVEKCSRCGENLLSRVRALGPYAEPFRGLIHALKYREKTRLAGLLGQALATLTLQDTELRQADVVCAVPLHPARQRERGYNQSELLARVVSGETGIVFVDALLRKRNTPTQTSQSGIAQRRRNVEDAFRIRPGVNVAGARVVLVDDVTTSGATLNAAARHLFVAGARDVMGLVVAAASPAESS
ncbi:MAG: ComF family protein [candidate division WOR-3 bacterium]